VQRLTLGPAGTAGQVLGASDVGVARIRWQRLRHCSTPRAGWALAPGDMDLPHRRSFRLVPGREVRASVWPLGGGVLATACRDVLNVGLPAVGNAGTISRRTPARRAARAGRPGPAARRWSFPACGVQDLAHVRPPLLPRGRSLAAVGAAGAAGRLPSGGAAGAAGCTGHREAARRCPRTSRRRCRAGSILVRDETPRCGPPGGRMRPRAGRGVGAGT